MNHKDLTMKTTENPVTLSFEETYFSQPGRATQKSVYDAILRLGGASSAQIATECGMHIDLVRQVVTVLHTDELITRPGRQWSGSDDRLREIAVLLRSRGVM